MDADSRSPSGTAPIGRRAALLLLGGLAAAPYARAQLKSGDDPEASPQWQKLRAALFQDRPISTQVADIIQLETPRRAEDAAVVPVAIRAQFAQSEQRSIQRLWLIVDNNPSPVSATFQYTLDSGRADIETRIRIDEYSFVRAVAETNDGRLWMAANFVKASGGCSAPPGKDPQAALASLGKIRLRVDGDVVLNQATLAQLMISHPNDSGLAMDQLTRQFTPRRYVRTVNVAYDGQPVLSADLDFSISENPNLRFYFLPRAPGRLTADVVDSNQVAWKSSLDVAPTA